MQYISSNTRNLVNSTLILSEFEAAEVALVPQSYAYLKSRYSKQLEATPAEHQGIYRITPRDYVGRISLPGGVTLVIRPKVAVTNTFYMLCAEAGVAHFEGLPIALETRSDFYAFIAASFIAEVSKLLQQGLYRHFAPHEENLPFVRGRIMLAAQISRYGELKHRHACAYTDLTADTAENRALATTLHSLPALLGQGERELSRTARSLLRRFEGVSVIGRDDALDLLRGIRLHRLNARYHHLLGICRLILSNLSLDEKSGPEPFASFLINMPRLFEGFLTARLRAYLPVYGLRVVAQRHDYLDEARQVGIRPDVLVYARTGREPLLVLDAKYRRPEGTHSGLNRDLYQVSAYLDRYALKRGVLVYPQFAAKANAELKLHGTSKHLHVTTLDLSAPSPAALEANCATLAEHIVHLAIDFGE